MAHGVYRFSDDAILDAACAAFAGEGFDRTTMAAIAERAGTTKPTLYARFGSKERLFEAAVQREYELLIDHLFAAYDSAPDAPIRDRLRLWTSAYFDVVRDRPDGFRLTAEGERHAAAAAVIRRANDRIIARIAQLVATMSGHVEPGPGARIVAAMIAGMLTWAAREAVDSSHVALEDVEALSEAFLLPALRALDVELVASVRSHSA